MADFTIAFPDFPVADMPAIPAGFVDTSWHNDACPSFTSDEAGLTIWINYVDPALREGFTNTRFSVAPQDHGIEISGDCLDTDDWQAVLDFITKKMEH